MRFTSAPALDFPAPPPARQLWQEEGLPVFKMLGSGGLTSVQDQGRIGWLERGVPISGALDQYALLAANALVGNPPGAAALEITLLGPKLQVLSPTLAAVCGADLGFRVDGRPAPAWTPLALAPGQILSFRGPKDGARAVLAVSGGLAALPLLGSRSTYALGRLGAPLQAGDILCALPGPLPPAGPALPRELRPVPSRTIILRVLAGPNQEFFTPRGQETFLASTYLISSRADRRGVRLEGPVVELNPTSPSSIVSEPNLPGIVQVLPDGQPMVLLNEQTVGGYAKIATIISPDLELLARALPGDTVRFARLELAEAMDAVRRQAGQLRELRRAAQGG
ncbi:putative 5-oxoprolinase subunit C [Desulfarculales bacterium]